MSGGIDTKNPFAEANGFLVWSQGGIEPLYPNDNCGFLTLRWHRRWLHISKNITK
ncbi:MAG TPA: hypothetical protein VJJ55_01320 [Candidatus Paceibacterota bacterium]